MTWYWPDWLLHLIPGLVIYQTLGTLRHELAHAVACKWSGDRITEIVIFPHIRDGLFYWGRVNWAPTANSRSSVHRYLAPYYVAAIIFLLGCLLVRFADKPWENTAQHYFNWWIFGVMNLIISPVVDTCYNVYKWLRYDRGDFAKALKEK